MKQRSRCSYVAIIIFPTAESCTIKGSKIMQFFFSFAHLSRMLELAFLIKSPLSVVGVVVNFSHFHPLLQMHRISFKKSLAQSIIGWRGYNFKWWAMPFRKGIIILNYLKFVGNFQKSFSLKPFGQKSLNLFWSVLR